MAIVDALGEDKLNFWGISYGTILGLTLAGMFPDRMGRVVLDSVVNPYDYYES
jgi:pimeloyl-ACP methyl ester carboxylesterase